MPWLPLTVTMWSAMRFGAHAPSVMVESVPEGAVASPGRRRPAQVTASYPVRVVVGKHPSIGTYTAAKTPQRRLANLRYSALMGS